MELNLVNTMGKQKRYRAALWIIGLCALLYVNLILFLFGEQQIQTEPAPSNSLITDHHSAPLDTN